MEIVVAMTENFVIGNDGTMPWHLPADLAHFKKLTSGHTIIMGRRTWESIGRPLPNRINIVITRQQEYEATGATVVHSLEEALLGAGSDRTFLIGGGEIYAQAIKFASHLHITRIHTTMEGDAFFPDFDRDAWSIETAINRPADDKNHYELTFETWSQSQ